jgi:hypothetical protein
VTLALAGDKTKLKNGKTVNICYYRYGQLAVIAVPIVYTGGEYAVAKIKEIADISKISVSLAENVLKLNEKLIAKGVFLFEADGKTFIKNATTGEVVTVESTSITDVEKALDSYGVQGAGKLTLQQIDDWVKFATKQNEAGINKVMLGMWDGGGANSYITKAGKNHTYFDFGNKWDEVYGLVNKSDDEIWKINKEFMDRQKSAGKEFWFSHDPFSPKNEQFFAREVNYIIDLGAKDFQKVGDLWKAVW